MRPPTAAMDPLDTGHIALRGVEVFVGLPDDVLALVRSYLEVGHAHAGTVLFNEGDVGDSVYIVRHGTVRIVKNQDGSPTVLARRGRGDIIGEMALIDDAPRFATAVCETDCELFLLSRSRFFKILAAHPDVAERILRVMTARVREADVRRLRELEQTNHDLEAARARLEAALTYRDRVLAVSPYPIMVTDQVDRVQLVNAAAERLFGHTTQSNLWRRVVPKDPSVPFQADQRLSERTSWQAEIEVEGPQENSLSCKVTAVPIADTGDGQAGRLWMFEDLTEVRALQQQAIQQEQLATKGEMAAEIAHELNNFLAILSGNAEMLELHLGGTAPAAVSRALTNIRQGLDQVGVFTDGLLRSRHPSGQRTTINLNDFLQSQIAFVRPQKRFRKIAFQTDWDESIPPLECDPSGLQQVVYNLFLNAADALTEMLPEHHTVFVTTRHLPASNSVRVTVGDDGPGIAPDLLGRLFYERVSTKPDGHGFGLLTIARIVSEHGGTIKPATRADGGAEFVITLPLTPTPSEQAT